MIYIETTLLDEITTRNGRISKKLYRKIVEPYIEKLNDTIYELEQNLIAAEDNNHYLNLAKDFRDEKYKLEKIMQEMWEIHMRSDIDFDKSYIEITNILRKTLDKS